MIKNILKSVTLLSLSALSLFGKSPVDSGIDSQILHYANGTDPATLDPHISSGLPEYKILLALFEGLVALDPETAEPIPGVAKSWEVSPDGKVYTFHLRAEAKWSNGEHVTAHDFVFSAMRVLTSNLGSPSANLFYPIKNAKDFYFGKIKDFDKVGLKALDDSTLEITLEHPLPYYPKLLAYACYMPVHAPTVLKYGEIDSRSSGWDRTGRMVCNGPFILKSRQLGQNVIVEKNPYYWDKEAVKLKEIHFASLKGAENQERAYATKMVHATDFLPSTKIPSYKGRKDLRMHPYFCTHAYVFNTTKAPFNDVRVRKAFSMALKRGLVNKVASGREEAPALRYTPENCPGYSCDAALRESLEEARELLAEAGYPEGKDFPKVQMLYNNSDTHRAYAEAMQQMWKKHLGVEVELVNKEWKVYLADRKSGNFDMVRLGWVGDYLDPNAFLELFTESSPSNYSGWTNAQYSALIGAASKEVNAARRMELLAEAEGLLLEELPVMPYSSSNTAYLVHESVKGWHPNLLDLHNWKYVYLENEKS